MGRKLATVLLLAVFGFSSTVSALGLGSIESETALNEPLSARIPLRSVEVDDLSEIRVTLASTELFERAGLERPFHLSRLSFSVEEDGGEPYISITSRQPVKEPFLDFLIEVRWPRGRMVREYTLLLDPPVYAGEEGTVVSDGGRQAAADEPPRSSGEAREGRGAVTAAAARDEPPAAGTDVVGGEDSGSGTYGPVGAGQTLWQVASEVQPGSGVTVQQTMLALLRANPDAFIDGDMNRLKRGAVLRVPARGEIASIGRGEALREVRAQIARWRERNEARMAAEGGSDGAEGAGDGEDLAAADADETAAPAAEGRLEVVAPEDSQGEQAGTSLVDRELMPSAENVSRLQERLSTLEEANASLESENADLRDQVQAMREELATLQTRINLSSQVPPGASGESGETEAAPQEEPAGADDPAAEREATGEEVAEGAQPETAAAGEEPGSAETVAGEPEAGGEAPGEQTGPEAAEPEEQVAAEPEEQGAMAKARALLDTLMQDTRMLAIGGLGVLLLCLLLLMVLRRRRSAAAAEEEAAFEDDSLPASVGAAAVTAGGETVSPPAEDVDALMAAGRLEEAQDSLDRALGEDPSDKEKRLKLLEILVKRGDRGGFEAEAQVLHTQIESEDDPLWQRVVTLGREIAPENPLFSDGSEDEFADTLPGTTSEVPGAGLASGEDSLDPRSGGLEPAGGSEAEGEFSFDLDFGLDDRDADEAVAGDAVSGHGGDFGTEAGEGLDLRLDQPESTQESGELNVGGSTEGDAGLEFSLDEPLSGPGSEQGDAGVAASDGGGADDAGSLEFELPEFRDEADTGAARADADQPPAAGDFDLDLDLDSLSLDDQPVEDQTGESDVDLDALDEVSTKLDLARAYLDMGDSEGARSLLDEVVEEGNDSQKREAEDLLRKAG